MSDYDERGSTPSYVPPSMRAGVAEFERNCHKILDEGMDAAWTISRKIAETDAIVFTAALSGWTGRQHVAVPAETLANNDGQVIATIATDFCIAALKAALIDARIAFDNEYFWGDDS